MKKAILGAALAAAFSMTTAQADCWDCCPDWCDGEYRLGAHALYINVGYCEAPIASFTDFETGVTTSTQLLPRYNWGVRPYFRADWGCYSAEISYSWCQCFCVVQLHEDQPIINTQFATTILPNGEFSRYFATDLSSISVWTYQHFDARLAHEFCGSRCSHLRGYAAVRAVDLDIGNKTNITNTANDPVELNRDVVNTGFWGIGPGIGVELYIDAWCNIGVKAECELFGLASRRRGTNFNGILTNQSSVGPPLVGAGFLNPTHSTWIPNANMKLGLDWSRDCGCYCFQLEFGFQLDRLFGAGDAIGRLESIGNAEPSSNIDFYRICEGFTFAGIYFGGNIGF